MKKLVLAIAVSLITLNSFSQNTKTYKKGEVISSETWLVGPPAVAWDSVKDRKDQIKSVNELNAIRKKAGKPLLKWDDRLQPAAMHHITYMRYCKKHHLINTPALVEKDTIKFRDYGFMGHKEMFDIPNFKEIVWPDWRISLLDRTVFSEMTEELGGGGNVMGYDFCPYHWAGLNDPKWDAVYSYWDPVIKINITILASYKKLPIKK